MTDETAAERAGREELERLAAELAALEAEAAGDSPPSSVNWPRTRRFATPNGNYGVPTW